MKKKDILLIVINITAGVFNIAGGVIHNNFDKFMVGILFLLISFMMFLFEKATKWRGDIINLQNEYIEKQDKIMLNAFKELANPTVIIDTKNITIPKEFAKPRKEKLNSRIQYYNENKCFEVPIVINTNNELVDGYTSYLIAKKYNMKTVQAKVKINK